MTKAERQQQWEARVAAYKASGQGTSAWCAAHDIKPHQLRYWLRKLEPVKATATPSKWLSVEVDEQSNESESSLLIRVGQATVEVKTGFNPALLSDVVRTLAALC
jgi:transposase-like protein